MAKFELRLLIALCWALAGARPAQAIELERFTCSAFRGLVGVFVPPRGDLRRGVVPRRLALVSQSDPVLRRVAHDLPPEAILRPENQALFDDMIHTMSRSGGVGLAAPQIGKSLRVAVVMGPKGPLIVVNPKIEIVDATRELASEGCLSLPGSSVVVARARRVRVHFYDRTGTQRLMEMDGFPARVAQHEADHLDGILITDPH